MRIGVVFAICFGMMSLCGVATAQQLNPGDFRNEVQRALLERRPNLCVRAIDDFTLKFGPSASECDNAQLNIDNSYADYRSDESRKAAIISRLVGTALTILDPPSATAEPFNERLVAIIRPYDYAPTGVTKPFAGKLALFLALDSDDRLELVLKDRFKTMKMSEADAWALAQKNIRQRLGPMEKGKESGITIVGAKSGLAPSALLLPEACDSRGVSEVVFLANRDSYFSVDQHDASGLKALYGVAQRMIADGVAMSNTLMACKEGKWVAVD